MGAPVTPLINLDWLSTAAKMAEWKSWFAWYPVKVHNKWQWMTTVYRRKILFTDQGVDLRPGWKYGNIFDIVKQ